MWTDDLEMKIVKMIKYNEITKDGLLAIQEIAEKFNAEHLLELAPKVIQVILDSFFEVDFYDPIIWDFNFESSELAEIINEHKRYYTLNSAAAALLLVLDYFNIHINVEKFVAEANKCRLEVDSHIIKDMLKSENVREYTKAFIDSFLRLPRSGYPKVIILKLKKEGVQT